MAGQDYSKYQRGVIQRYYEHADTIALQKLSEIVSDLYLAEGSHATRLWNNARQALAKLAAPDDPHVLKVLSVRSVTGLAKLVTELSAGAKASASDTQAVAATTPVVGGSSPAAPITGASTSPQGASTSNSPGQTSPTAASSSASAAPTADELRHAMKAFKKRLKLTRLDEESKLGRVGNPMSGGKRSGVVAIMPPREYSQAVWDELVRQGRLRHSGGSFYELVEG